MENVRIGVEDRSMLDINVKCSKVRDRGGMTEVRIREGKR